MNRFIIAICLCSNFNCVSQTNSYNDAQLWVNVYLEKKISDKFLIHLNQKDRFTENISRFNFAYADIGVTYKITKNIKIRADYVFAQKRREDASFSNYHKFYIAVTLKKDFDRWRFSYRAKFQIQYRNPFTSEYGSIPLCYSRNKFTIKYELNKRISFYVAEELYIPLNSSQFNGIDRTRSFVGIIYETFKHQQVEFYFMYQDRLQNRDWYKQRNTYKASNYLLQKDFVYGVGYSIAF